MTKPNYSYKDIELRAGKIMSSIIKTVLRLLLVFMTRLAFTSKGLEFQQGDQASTQDSLIYNFQNEKALIYNSKN